MNRLPFLQVLEADFPFRWMGYLGSLGVMKTVNLQMRLEFQPFLFFLQCLEGSGYKAKPYVVTPPETSVAPENSWLEDYF